MLFSTLLGYAPVFGRHAAETPSRVHSPFNHLYASILLFRRVPIPEAQLPDDICRGAQFRQTRFRGPMRFAARVT